MTPPRRRMIDDMQLSNLAPRTIATYAMRVAAFARHFGRSPEALGPDEVRAYLLHLVQEKHVSWSVYNQTVAALKFLYEVTLERQGVLQRIRCPKQPKKLPTVLSTDEVARFFAAILGVKHRAILMTAYAAGLRVSEVVSLRVDDIDSQRMVIRVRQGKGRKDRYVMLSPRLLALLREYWKAARPDRMALPRRRPGPTPSPARPCTRSASRPLAPPGSASTSPSTPSGTASPPTCLRPAPTSARSRSSSGTATSRPPPSTPTSRPPPARRRGARSTGSHPSPGESATMTRPGSKSPTSSGDTATPSSNATATALSHEQRRVLRDLVACRTAALGGHVEECDRCGHRQVAYNSCRNRHCPKCQATAAADWMEDREAELLPVEYFHVVFTLPAALSPIALQNPRVVYGLLFRAAAETLQQVAADPKHLGAEIGFLAVLHTWGQNLQHHPHVHCVVPGGGIAPDGSRWVACRPGFFLPVRILSRVFRGKFLPCSAPPSTAGSSPSTASSAPWPTRPNSDAGSPAPPGPSGSSTPSPPSAARSRCSSIWPGTPNSRVTSRHLAVTLVV